eukprot:1299168-Ditylum_brightwellii.AAC.1
MAHYHYCCQKKVKGQGGLLNRYLGKEALLNEDKYCVGQWMAQKLGDLKRTCKRSSTSRKKTTALVVEVEKSNKKLGQLRRERHAGQKDIFEKNMKDRLKKYKKEDMGK